MTRLKPNFLRVAFKIGLAVIIFSILGYFLQGYREGKWWSWGYIGSLAMPLLIMPVAAWFMFVPRVLEFSDYEITISSLLRSGTYRWPMLDAYGPGPSVFMIQFCDEAGAYQILSAAYPKEEWSKLINFLRERYPEKETSFSIGGRLFRR